MELLNSVKARDKEGQYVGYNCTVKMDDGTTATVLAVPNSEHTSKFGMQRAAFIAMTTWNAKKNEDEMLRANAIMSNIPNVGWTKKKIQAYMEEEGVSFVPADNKAALLKQILTSTKDTDD